MLKKLFKKAIMDTVESSFEVESIYNNLRLTGDIVEKGEKVELAPASGPSKKGGGDSGAKVGEEGRSKD